MEERWSRPIHTPIGGHDYWDYFGVKLVKLAAILPGSRVLDVGCGTGPSLFPAAEKAGVGGHAVGIDICPS